MELKNKKILVTGGVGFLGTHIVAALIARGVPAQNISIPRSEELDLRKRENCERAVAGMDLVIHAAGTKNDPSFHKEHPAEAFFENAMMGVQLMEAARVAGVQKFVTIGSATEYPDNAPLPYREEDIWIGPPEKLHMPYTTAKRMLLEMGQAYRKQYGMNVIHLILTNLYGPGEPTLAVIPTLIMKIEEAKKTAGAGAAGAGGAAAKFIEMWGAGNPTRDFLYVDDAAEGIVLAAEKYDRPEPINLASSFEISIRELTGLVSSLMGFDGEVRWDAAKPDGQARRMLNTTRASQEFGFKAATDFEIGLRKTIEYHEHGA